MSTPRIMPTDRLAYVVMPIEGTVTRPVVLLQPRKVGVDAKGNPKIVHERTQKLVEEPAGFMVYFPQGHALRIATKSQLRRYNLTPGAAGLVSMAGLMSTEVQKLVTATSENERAGVFRTLEQKVIDLATRKSGPNILTKHADKIDYEEAA